MSPRIYLCNSPRSCLGLRRVSREVLPTVGASQGRQSVVSPSRRGSGGTSLVDGMQRNFRDSRHTRGEQTGTTSTRRQLRSSSDRPYRRPQGPYEGVIPPEEQTWDLPTDMGVTWLGTSSGCPTVQRNISCTLLRLPDAIYMVDCGEGSHRQLQRTKIPLEQVERIFITHLHGDHCFGLATMLLQLSKAKETSKDSRYNYVYGPPGTVELLRACLVTTGLQRQMAVPLIITELVTDPSAAHPPREVDKQGKVLVARLGPERSPVIPGLKEALGTIGLRSRYNNTREKKFVANPNLMWTIPCARVVVRAAQLQHRVPCWGYVFDELPTGQQQTFSSISSRPAGGERVGRTGGGRGPLRGSPGRGQGTRDDGGGEELDRSGGVRLPTSRQGFVDVRSGPENGAHGLGVADNSLAPRPRRVVILGDTMQSEPIAPLAVNADLLAHEATFSRGMEEKAQIAQHSTAWMAGQFARVIRAKQLVLTHFSGRYVDAWVSESWSPEVEAEEQLQAIQGLLQEAKAEFQSDNIAAARDFYTFHVPR